MKMSSKTDFDNSSFDIEDIISNNENEFEKKAKQERQLAEQQIFPKNFVRKKIEQQKKEIVGYDIPGIQTVFMKTFGCSHNTSDSEYMAGQLASYGYSVTENFENADIYIINSCTVKNPSQDAFFNLLDNARATGKPVVVAGCVPQGQPSHPKLEKVSIIGVQQINRVVEVVEETLKGNTVRFVARSKNLKPALDLPKIRRNPFIEIIPINLGCLNNCTYCKTKHARGQLLSYPIKEIANRVNNVIKEGVLEIRITSEDTGAYGRDIGTNLPELLRALAQLIPDGVMLRVGMTNPPYILEHLDEICEILNHERVYSFLHVPIQSGSDQVLRDMAREYTSADFCRVVETLQAKVPGVTIATDIICGFPTETANDFEQTLNLVKKYQFPILNISQFYPRPGTPAARMKRVPTSEVKQRSRELTKLFDSYQPFNHLVGTRQRVWITEYATDGVKLVGHTKSFIQVLIDPNEAEIGTNAIVDIISATKFSVFAKVVPGTCVKAKNLMEAQKIDTTINLRKENLRSQTEACECSEEEQEEIDNDDSNHNHNHNQTNSDCCSNNSDCCSNNSSSKNTDCCSNNSDCCSNNSSSAKNTDCSSCDCEIQSKENSISQREIKTQITTQQSSITNINNKSMEKNSNHQFIYFTLIALIIIILAYFLMI
eukprot:TRINITY_DN618_c1_g2_i4.p1 TRINITY_DN618_c1_g2~~TRINITY_DN618_c1_g2_i4.p1  ORF type:complete len:658 (-),score=284.40 TRINITY_DN618_c1_g2_i4:33-2006(-)